jgi:hypothetical protein
MKVQWQFRLTPRARRIWGELTRAHVRDLKHDYLETGKSPQGVRITITVWGKDWTQQQARAHVAARWRGGVRAGLVDHYAGPQTTLHDYDGREPPTMAEIAKIAANLGARIEAIEYAASRRGWHVAITWARKWTPAETVAVQAILGSDPNREAYNLGRVLSGNKNAGWNILFKKKIK